MLVKVWGMTFRVLCYVYAGFCITGLRGKGEVSIIIAAQASSNASASSSHK